MAQRVTAGLRLLRCLASSLPVRHVTGRRAANFHISRPVHARNPNDDGSEVSHRDASTMNFPSDKEASRSVSVLKVPKFALAEDMQLLFEESGIAVERVHMLYDPLTGWNSGYCVVYLRPPSTPSDAVKSVEGAVLFNSKLQVVIKEGLGKEFDKSAPNFKRGWHAAASADLQDIRLREPLYEYPTDLFAPTREGRHIVVENFDLKGVHKTYLALYRLFYGSDVLGTSGIIRYVPKTPKLNGWLCHMYFATREDADMALLLNGSRVGGRPIVVARAKIPLKYTASWDNMIPSGHNRSSRDSGSAAGTNFENMQEELFRKWRLGPNDRKLWIPSHSYRRTNKEKGKGG